MGFKVDGVSKIEVVPTIWPQVLGANATVDGDDVSLTNAHSAVFVITAGTFADGSHVVELQESVDGGDNYTAIADDNLTATEPTITNANDDAVWEIGYMGGAGMIRASVTSTSVTNGGAITVNVVLGHHGHKGGSSIIV